MITVEEIQDMFSRKEIMDLAQACYNDKELFAKTIFPDRFDVPFSPGHDQIFEILEDDECQLAAIAASRGFGKSTINLVNTAHEILYRKRDFIIPISCTSTQAVLQSENLKGELERNSFIRVLFGTMKGQKFQNQSSDMYTKDMWVAKRPDERSGTLVMPRGSGQQVRGFLYGSKRPDLILIDDLEDAETVTSEEQRAKLKKWFFEDVLNSVRKYSKKWRVIFIGTILHEDSLLSNLLELSDWRTLRLSICNDNYESNWPEAYSNDDILRLVKSFKELHMLDSFYREYMNLPIATEDASFTSDMMQEYDENSVEFRDIKHRLVTFVIVDPAKTVTSTAAKSAIMVISVDVTANKLYVRECYAEAIHPDFLYERIAELCFKWETPLIGVEVTSLNEFIMQPLRNFLGKLGRHFHIVELKPRGNSKEQRAKWLSPYYRNKLVFHNKDGNCQQLEIQLKSFPRPKYWDLIDCMAYTIQMLYEGNVYFDPIADSKDEEQFERDMERFALEDKAQGRLNDWRIV